MLFECSITQAEGNKQYLVEASNYAEAEQRFAEYAAHNVAGEYELTGINRSHSLLSIANECKVVNAQDVAPQQRRIGFNAQHLDRMVKHQPVYKQYPLSDIVINF